MSLFISLRSEVLKTRRTAAFYLTGIAAAFGPLMSMLDASFGEGVSATAGPTIFNKMMTDKFDMTGFVLFPMFIVLICTLLAQVEYKNNAWKQVLASPQTKANVFMAKFINTHLLVLAFLVINMLTMLLTVLVLHFRNPSFHILSQPINVSEILLIRFNTYVAVLAMSAIQFWLGLRFKNFIVPIAVGFSCWIIGTLLVVQFESGLAAYFPYSFPIASLLPKYKPQLNGILYTAGALAIIFLVLGFRDFKRNRTNT